MDAVLHSFDYCLDFLSDQLADVAPADLAALPSGIANHPAWVVGHLTFTCQKLGGVIGLAEFLPSDWAARFGPGSVPVPDADAYETKENALAILRDARSRIASAVKQLEESRLDEPFPDPSYRDVFPTVRHALTQVLAGHTAYHLAQVSHWRAAMRLPRLARSFE